MKHIFNFFALLTFLGLFFISSLMIADDKDKKDEPKKNSEKKELKITIDKIEGSVDVKLDKDSKWQPAKEKMELKTQSQVATGFESKAIINFGERGIIELSSLTMLQISEFLEDPEGIKASMKINSGEVGVEVKKGVIKADFKIKTPNITAAVKGTKFKVRTESDKGDGIFMDHGTVMAYDLKGNSIIVSKDDVTETKDGALQKPFESELSYLLLSYTPQGTFEAEKEYTEFMGELNAYIQSDFSNDLIDPSEESEGEKIADEIFKELEEIYRSSQGGYGGY